MSDTIAHYAMKLSDDVLAQVKDLKGVNRSKTLTAVAGALVTEEIISGTDYAATIGALMMGMSTCVAEKYKGKSIDEDDAQRFCGILSSAIFGLCDAIPQNFRDHFRSTLAGTLVMESLTKADETAKTVAFFKKVTSLGHVLAGLKEQIENLEQRPNEA